MTENELRALFAMCAADQQAEAFALLSGGGNHLAAVLVADEAQIRATIAEVDAQISAGEIDHLAAGAVVWIAGAAHHLPDGSLIRQGIPDCMPSTWARPSPIDCRVKTAWTVEACQAAEPPADRLKLLVWALATVVPSGDERFERLIRALADDHSLGYPYALAVFVDVARRVNDEYPVGGAVVDRCIEALARASPSYVASLTLPDLII